jgi:hypothetical protein
MPPGPEIQIGTSAGIRHWRRLSSPELPQKAWLEFYSGYFGTVEINSLSPVTETEYIDNWSIPSQRIPFAVRR